MNPLYEDDDPTHVRMDPVNEADTEQHYNLYKDETSPPTERILPEEPLPPPINYPPPPPIVYPAPPPVRRKPVQAETGLVDPRPYRWGRAGLAALIMGVLVAGVFIGFFIASLAAVQTYGGAEPQVQISTRTATATTTATATKTRTKTVEPTTINESPTATATVTATQKVKIPGRTRVERDTTTPQSCMTAMDAADQYLSIARRGGNGRNNGRLNRLLEEARADYRYWSDQCRNDS